MINLTIKAQEKKVNINIDSDKTIKRSEILEVAQKILEENQGIKQNQTIYIKYEEDNISYKLGKKKKFTSIIVAENDKTNTHEISYVTQKIFPKKIPSVKEIFAKYLEKWPPTRKRTRCLWGAVLFSMACIRRMLHPKKIFDISSNEMREDPFHREGLTSVLEEVSDILGDTNNDVKQQIDEGLDFSKLWRGKTGPERKELVKNFCTTMKARINGDNDEKTIALIPAGYWKDSKTFQPTLLSFSVNNGKLFLTEISYGENRGEEIKEFSFDSTDQLENLIGSLMNLTNEPSPDLKTKKGAAYSQVYLSSIMNIKEEEEQKSIDETTSEASTEEEQQKSIDETTSEASTEEEQSLQEEADVKPVPAKSLDISDLKQNLILAHGGSPISSKTDDEDPSISKKTGNLSFIKENPMQLVKHFIKSEGVQSNEYVAISFNLLHSHLKKMLPALHDIPLEKRKEWVHRLESERVQLYRKLDKAGIENLEDVVDDGKILSDYETCLDTLKNEIKQLKEKESASAENRLKKLKSAKKDSFSIKCLTNFKKTKTQSARQKVTNQVHLTNENQILLDNLGQLLKTASSYNLSEISENLEEAHNAIDALVENGEFGKAIRFYHLLMEHLPPPGMGLIEQIKLTGDKNLPETLSRSIHDINKCFWEAKMKIGEDSLSPREWVDMVNSQAFLSQCRDGKREILIDICIEKGLIQEGNGDIKLSARGCKNAGLDFEDYIHIMYKGVRENQLLDQLVQSVSSLKLAQNPRLGKKFRQVKKYIDEKDYGEKVFTQDRSRLLTNVDMEEEGNLIEELKKVIIKEQINDTIEKRVEKDKISIESMVAVSEGKWKEPPEDSKKQAIAFFHRMNSQNAMIRSLMHPKTAVGPIVSQNENKLLLKSLSNWGSPPKKRDENFYRQCNTNYKSYRKVLKGSGRLNLEVTKNSTEIQIFRNGSPTGFEVEAEGFCQYLRCLAPFPTHENSYDYNLLFYRDDNEIKSGIKNRIDNKGLRRLERHINETASANPFGRGSYSLNENFSDSDADAYVKLRQKESTNPHDAWNKQVINHVESNFSHIYPVESGHRHYTSYSIANAEEVVDLWIQRPDLLDSAEGRKDFHDVLFSQGILQESLLQNPQFFTDRLEQLKILIEEAEKQNNHERVIFLRYACSMIAVSASCVSGEPDDQKQEKLQIIIGDLSFLEDKNRFSFYSNGGLDASQQAEYAGYLLSYLSCNPDSLEALIGDVAALTTILKMTSQLELLGNEVPIPEISQHALEWVRESILPKILGNNELCNTLLNNWISGDLTGSWNRIDENSVIFQKGGTVVDLGNAVILKIDGKVPPGVPCALPKAFLRTEEYQKAIEGKDIRSVFVCPGGTAGEFLYTFSDSEGQKYQLTHLSHAGKFILETEKKGKRGRMRFQLLSSQKEEREGVEKLLEKTGVWIDLDNRKRGIANIKDGDNERRLILHFENKGKLKKVMTEDGMEVIHQKNGELESVLGSLPKEEILFLKNPKKKGVQQIHFLNQSISLKKEGENWMSAQDPKSQWTLGEQRLDTTQNLFKSLGPNVEQFGLTLRKGDSEQLLIWPHKIASDSPHKIPGHRLLKFEKNTFSGGPLCINISADGEVKGSCCSLMYMAYLFAAKHEFIKAAHFLDLAKTAKLEAGEEDFEKLFIIEEAFQELPENSVRENAIKLKGLLSLKTIKREQTTFHKQKAIDAEGQMKSSKVLSRVFSRYQRFLENSPLDSDKVQYQQRLQKNAKELTLNSTEIQELKRANIKSLDYMRVEYEKAQDLETGDYRLKTHAFNEEEVNMAINFALASMKKPLSQKEIRKRVENQDFSPKFISEHFFEIWNYIVDEGLTSIDLLPLIGSLADKELMESLDFGVIGENLGLGAIDENLGEAAMGTMGVSLLSKALLSLAASEGEKRKKISDSTCNKLRKRLPKSALGIVLKSGLFSTKNKLLADSVSLKTIQDQLKEVLKEEKLIFGTKAEKGEQPLSRPFSEGKEMINLDEFENKLELFNESVQEGIRSKLGELKQRSSESIIPLRDFESCMNSALEINLIEELQKGETEKRIQELESLLKEQSDAEPIYSKFTIEIEKPDVLSVVNSCFSTIPEEQKTNLKSLVKQFGEVFEEGDPVHAGIKNAEQKKLGEIGKKRILQKAKIEDVESFVNSSLKTYKDKASEARDSVLEFLKGPGLNGLPGNLARALANRDKISDGEIFALAISAYKTGKIDNLEIENKITEFLYYQISQQVLEGRVQTHLANLKDMSDEELRSNRGIQTASELKSLLENALNFDRYAEGLKENPSLYRKILATESEMGFVLRNEQIDLIKEMIEKPCDWYEMKVGMGKTSVVLPIVLLMQIEKGEFPVAVVKEELLQQNLDSLDRATRALLEHAGVEFTFSYNHDLSLASLQEEYLRLLEVEKDKGYIITSSNSIIAVDHVLDRLRGEMSQLLRRGESDGKIEELSQQIDYLVKIKDKLKFLLIDEADEIQSVIAENNVAIGNPTHLNTDGCRISKMVIKAIFSQVENSKGSEEVYKLQQAYLKGQQISLDKEELRTKIIPQLVNLTLSKFLEEFGENKEIDKSTKDSIYRYLYEKSNKDLPDGLSPSLCKKLERFKKIILTTLPKNCAQNPGIDLGIQEKNGFKVGPRVAGREKEGYNLGDEDDIIFSQYMSFAVEIPVNEFTENELKKIAVTYPKKYNQWLEGARIQDKKSIFDFLNDERNWEERVDFLEKTVITPKLIQKSDRQIVYNVQHLVYGREVGGVTGTLDKKILPKTRDGESSDPSKDVIGEVLLEAGILGVPSVSTVSEGAEEILQKMKELVNDSEVKSLINQGFDLKMSSSRVVEELRKGTDRDFVYVDTETRKFYMWKSGENRPQQISKAELNRLQAKDENFNKQAVFYFAPPDTRGTDFRIPPGKGVGFISAKCSEQDFVQLCGRMRGAGNIHRMDFVVSKGIEKRILAKTEKEEINYADVVKEINYADVVKDIFEENAGTLKAMGSERDVQEVERIFSRGIRDILDRAIQVKNSVENSKEKTIYERLIAEIDKHCREEGMGFIHDKSSGYDEEQDIISSENEKFNNLVDFIENLDIEHLDIEHLDIEKEEGEDYFSQKKEALCKEIRTLQKKLPEGELFRSNRDELSFNVQVQEHQVTQQSQQVQQLQLGQQQLQQQQLQAETAPINPDQRRYGYSQNYHRGLNKIAEEIESELEYNYSNYPYAEAALPLLVDSEIILLFKSEAFKINVSQNFLNCFFEAGGAAGRPGFAKFLIRYDAANSEPTLTLITHQEYSKFSKDHEGAKAFIQPQEDQEDQEDQEFVDNLMEQINNFGNNNEGYPRGKVYTPISQGVLLNREISSNEKGKFVVASNQENNEPIEEEMRLIVQAKFFLGVSDYSHVEMDYLRDWIGSIPEAHKKGLMDFIDKLGTQEQKECIQE